MLTHIHGAAIVSREDVSIGGRDSKSTTNEAGQNETPKKLLGGLDRNVV